MSGYKLLPCPFCGGKAKYKRVVGENIFRSNIPGCYVVCVNCGASSKTEWSMLFGQDDYVDRAFEKWNTRAQLSRQKGE